MGLSPGSSPGISEPPVSPGKMVTGNVRLVEPMARGGMGSVWRADHLGLDAQVAVKFINAELAKREPGLRERFKREASICAKLKSVHVVQTFDHGMMADGTPYIVMELLEGKTLTQRVELGGRMSPRHVGVIVSQVGKVLHRAHDLGIVHRDVKPDNVFVVDDDYELFVKVLDFGIAKSQHNTDGVVTKTGMVVGSPEFMSPEQAINSKAVDHRSDLYSLAVLAYYGLTGELPFEEQPDRPFWIQLADGNHIPATKRVPNLPSGLDAWFERALAPKPENRFQSARELADSLGEIVEGVGAGPVSMLSTSDDSQRNAVRSGPGSGSSLSEAERREIGEQDTLRMQARAEAARAQKREEEAQRAAARRQMNSYAPPPGPHSSVAPPPMPGLTAGPSVPPPPSMRVPMYSLDGAEPKEQPPWSQLPPPNKRPTRVVVVLALAAISVVIAAIALLTRL